MRLSQCWHRDFSCRAHRSPKRFPRPLAVTPDILVPCTSVSCIVRHTSSTLYALATPNRQSVIWTQPEPGRRRPAHTREEIAAAALAIADDEGIDAVTMRRVSRELGAGRWTGG